MTRWIVLMLLVVFGVSLGALAVFFRGATQGTVEFEAAKSLLQIGVVAVMGAVISVLIFEYQRERQAADKRADDAQQRLERQKENDRQAAEKQRELERKRFEYREALLLSTLSNAMNAYGRTKKARRLLRGRGIRSRGETQIVLASEYDQFFDRVNDAQLDLENLARDVKTSAKAFSEPEALEQDLWSMESYLGELISEYESVRSRFSENDPSLPVRDLVHLEDFLKSTDSSRFRPEMVSPYHEVQRRIRRDLLHPNLPEGSAV